MRKSVEEQSYQITNRERRPKPILSGHSSRPAWRPDDPAVPAERTRGLYRFRVRVEAGGGALLRVREERQLEQTARLADAGPDTVGASVQATQIGPRGNEAFQRVVALRDPLDRTVARRGRLEHGVTDIALEQWRIRENMGEPPRRSELYARYVTMG
jgi:hypothetical protein